MRNKKSILQFHLIIIIIFLLSSMCTTDSDSDNSDSLPGFINGIDENTYLAQWTAKTYRDQGDIIPSGDLPYKYFAAKGINFARIRVWVGNAVDGNYANALVNGLAAKRAGLQTLLVIFFSEQWSDNIGCDLSKLGSRFQGLSFEERKDQVYAYCREIITNFRQDGLNFDLYAIGNEVLNCLCGETSTSNMAEILLVAYNAVKSVDDKARFILHLPHVQLSAARDFFDEMITVHEVPVDFISTSFYPLQYGADAFNDFKAMVAGLYTTFGKKFIISEWSYADSELPVNSIWIQSGVMRNTPVSGYPLSQQGQADLVRDLLVWAKGYEAVKGIFYWGPLFNEENESGGVLYGWVWFSLFDAGGNAKQAINSMMY